jgi:hypothetical protein
MALDYIDTITSASLEGFVKRAITVFPEFTTVNESYRAKLEEMKEAVKRYFDDPTINRPFLYLVLGPPGAGKSHLMKALVKQLKEETKQSFAFQSVNVSEVLDPRELHRFYDNIALYNVANTRTITLLDEVDVRWTSGSAIKHLINPIYDGEYWDGAQSRKFGRCAFFFAGSYLQDRETLVKTQRLLSRVDLSRFLLDIYIQLHGRSERRLMDEIEAALQFCYTQQKWRSDIDPHADTLLYLQNLDKIRDFLSRIAGNVFEMVDVSAPLHLTGDPFRVSGDDNIQPSPRLRATELVRSIKLREKETGQFEVFESPSRPILQYKNAVLCERLLRVVGQIARRFKSQFKKGTMEFLIDRPLLNFLTVVPLINGMRSLEQLINKLELAVDTAVVSHPGYKLEDIAMMIHNAGEFEDVTQVWYRMKRVNDVLDATLQRKGIRDEDIIRVPIAG